MKEKLSSKVLKSMVVIIAIVMIVINYVAIFLPLNGVTTKDISDRYPSMFVPAGYAFLIWALIYIMIFLFIGYQTEMFKGMKRIPQLNKVRIVFIISSLFNIGWIFAFHYGQMLLSTFFIVLLLICLVIINAFLYKISMPSKLGSFFVKVTFSLYFGWIIVATIASISTALVYYGWDRWGGSEQLWLIIMLIISAVILLITGYKYTDFVIGAVAIWSYIGILVKQIAEYNSSNVGAIVVLSLLLLMFAVAETLLILIKVFDCRICEYKNICHNNKEKTNGEN